MRHLHTGRKLGVGPDHRVARLRSLTLALIENDEIQTTPARAKELRWWADRVISLAKRNDVAGRRQLVSLLGSTITNVPGQNRVRLAIGKVVTDLVPRFRARNGGYTQMFRLAQRRAGDNAELCVMRYLPVTTGKAAPKKKLSEKVKDAVGKKSKAAQSTATAPQDRPHDQKAKDIEAKSKAGNAASPPSDKEK